MFDNEIIMQGARLKKYRINMLGATQDEIAQGICTKNWLSQIENGRKKLNFNLAAGIAGNFNRTAKKKGINISLITPEELMRDEDGQANYILQNSVMNELKELKKIKAKDLFEKKLQEAEDLIKKYNIADNIKIQLYRLVADFYYIHQSYVKSDEMCRKGLEASRNLTNSLEEVNIYIYKSRNCIPTIRYNEGLELLEYAEKLNNRICNDDLSVMIFFYRALTYKKLCEYDKALECFKILEKFEIKDKKMLLRVKMVYANCLNDYHQFEEAEKEYKGTLSIAMEYDDKDFIAMAYRNLSELYFNKKDYKSAAKYIEESFLYNPKNEYLGENLYFASEVFKNLNEDVEPYLKKALDICEKKDRENVGLIHKTIYELALFYIKKEDEENLMLMAEKAKALNIDYSLIYAVIGEYYRGRNEGKSRNFSNESIEKLKQIKNV